MSNIIWTAERGWHDGAECTVTVNAAGRLEVAEIPPRGACSACSWDGTGRHDDGCPIG